MNARPANRHLANHNRDRAAVTVIELSAVVGVLGVAIALLLPAIQSARESARQVDCQQRLRQTGSAMNQHLSVHRCYPTNGGRAPSGEEDDLITSSLNPRTIDYWLGGTVSWGVGQFGTDPRQQPGSAFLAVLPFLESADVGRRRAYDAVISTLLCPSRYRGEPSPAGRDALGEYHGGAFRWAKVDWAVNRHVIVNRPTVHSSAFITDGTSATIMMGEKYQDPVIQNPACWLFDEPYWLGGSHGTSRERADMWIDRRSENVRGGWGSAHPAGAGFVRFDGSVETIDYGIDRNLLMSLLHPRDAVVTP